MTVKSRVSAFPREDYQADCTAGQPGMELLDYFAAKAMQALLSDTTTMANCSRDARESGIHPTKYIASAAYDFADYMLAERARRNP